MIKWIKKLIADWRYKKKIKEKIKKMKEEDPPHD